MSKSTNAHLVLVSINLWYTCMYVHMCVHTYVCIPAIYVHTVHAVSKYVFFAYLLIRMYNYVCMYMDNACMCMC